MQAGITALATGRTPQHAAQCTAPHRIAPHRSTVQRDVTLRGSRYTAAALRRPALRARHLACHGGPQAHKKKKISSRYVDERARD
jgi:hypothetical protein